MKPHKPWNKDYWYGVFYNIDGTVPDKPIVYRGGILYGTNEHGEQSELTLGDGLVIVGGQLSLTGVTGLTVIDDDTIATGTTYSSYKITNLINSIIGFSIEIVETLPPIGKSNTLYLVPSDTLGENNIYDEYLWIDEDWELVGTTKIDLSAYYTKTEIDELLAEKQDKLNPSSGITISGETINANTDAITVEDIQLSNGAPITALNIWPNNKIPQGTSVQEILVKLLCRELYPDVATIPSITANGTNFGVKELNSTVTITTPTVSTNNGHFNASFDDPAQPEVSGVTWSATTVTTAVTGFTGSAEIRTIVLGQNIITYAFSKNYSAPINKPITNLNHETTITSSGESAIWTDGTATASCKTTATGVYACFTNISGDTLENNPAHKCALTDGDTIILEEVPSEVVSDKHFKFAFPADRTVTFEIRDLSGNFVPFSSTYEINIVENAHYGVDYKVLETTGAKLGSNTYKMILSKRLNK